MQYSGSQPTQVEDPLKSTLILATRRLTTFLVATLCIVAGIGAFSGSSGASQAVAHAASSSCSGVLPSGSVVGVAATTDDDGYWIANNKGEVVACGDATNFGSLTTTPAHPIVGMAATPDGHGLYLVASDGGVFTLGDAVFQGSTGALVLNKPIVGMTVDPATGGYWLVASDGGIFTFNTPFEGSTGAMTLNKPIVGMADDPETGGYWLVASDGGIFSFNAPFQGSTGALKLNKPVVGMALDPATGGYWLVASDGGIFSFNAPFYGSTGAIVLNEPIEGMESNSTGTGYRFVASDGGVFDFGASQFFGSAVGVPPASPPTSPGSTTVLNQSGNGSTLGIIGPLNLPKTATTFTVTVTYSNCTVPVSSGEDVIEAELLPLNIFLRGYNLAGGSVSQVYSASIPPASGFGVQITSPGGCSWNVLITAT